jgi:proline dehydrogenase
MVRLAASRYVVGSTADHAAAVASRLAARGYSCTVCYWDSGREDPARVAAEYRLALDVARAAGGYVSVKATAVGFSRELLARLAGSPIRLHFDAMTHDTVDATMALLDDLPSPLGTTLPGRWRRSDDDAEWAVERGLAVRVVKGMWEGPDDRNPVEGFLSVVDRLAGRAAFVSVATHDGVLAAEALSRLRSGGTPCELEQLYGLPRRPSPARVYLPYGTAWLPYALSRVRLRPRTVWWLARDLALAPLAARG